MTVRAYDELETTPPTPPALRPARRPGGVGAAVRRWAPRLVGIALFVWAFAAAGPREVWRGLAAADPWPIVPAVLVAVPFICSKGWRWARIGAALGLPLPLGEASRLYAIGIWAGLVTPGQAGDFLKAWYLRARGVPLAPALLSCLLDRLFDLAALLGLGAFALLAFAGAGLDAGGGTGRSLAPIVLALIAVCAALGAAMSLRWRAPLLRLLARYTPRRLRERLAGNAALGSLLTARLDGRHLAGVLALTALSWVISLGRVYLCFVAVGVRLAPLDFLIVLVLITLAGLISVSGIGTRDAALYVLLGHYGYSGGQALAISLLILLLNLSNIVPGFLLWLRDPVPMRRALAGEGGATAGSSGAGHGG